MFAQPFLIFCCSCFLILITEAATGPLFQGTWRLARLQITRRRMHGMTCTTNDMWVHGGMLADGTTTNSLWRFQAKTGSWSLVTPAGEAPFLLGLTLSYVDPYLYAFGGSPTLENPKPVSSLFLLDVNSTSGIHKNLWVEYTTDTGPSPRFRHRTVTVGKTLVAMFGFGMDKYQNTVWSFDTVSKEWTRLHPGGSGPNIPSARFDPCCKYTADFHSTYCFGGTTEEDDSNELWMFMHANSTWKLIPGTGVVPPARRSATCGIVNGVFFLASGLNSTSGVPQGWDIYQVSLRDPSYQWVLSPQTQDPKVTPDPRDQALMCDRFNGTTMLFGGINGDGVHHNDLWAITTLPSGLLSYRNVQSDIDMPARRHSGIIRTLGSGVVVGFGRADVGLFDDLWKLDMSKQPETWIKLSLIGNSGFLPRFGNRAVVRGSLLLFFGGQTSATDKLQLSSELLTFDMDTRKWGIIRPQTPTEGRVYHGMVNSGLLVLVFGGYAKCASGVCITSDVRLYDPVSQTWNVGYSTDGVIPSARFGHEVTINFRNGWSYIIGGINARTALSTRWKMSPATTMTNSSGTYYFVTFQRLPSTFGNLPERTFIRGGGAIAGFQNHYLVCGGLISPLMGARDSYQCYDYDANTGLNTLVSPPPFSVRYGASVYVMNKVVVFGGGMVSNSVPMTDRELNYVMIYDVNPASYCAEGVTDDSNCLMCAPGSKNPTCTLAPPGTYQDNPSVDPVPCTAGTYSTYLGAYLKGFCRFCEKGWFASGSGASGCTPCPSGKKCPLGQPNPIDLNQAAGDLDISDDGIDKTIQQPTDFKEGAVPQNIYIVFLVLVIFVILFASVLYYVQRYRIHRRIHYYLNDTSITEFHRVYADYARALGLGRQAFEKCLLDPRMPTSKVIMPEHVDRLFHECNDGGSGLIRFERVCTFIAHLIEEEILDPFEDTPAVENIHYATNFLDLVDLLSFDSFTDSHRTMDVGEPIVITKTTLGGFVSIANMTFQIILVALLVTMFSYDNIQEMRSVLPGELVETSDIEASFYYSATQSGARDPLLCVDTNGRCAAGVGISIDGISSRHGNSSARCVFIPPSSCSITWECDRCSLPNLDAMINFTFHPQWYADTTTVELESRSGVQALGSDTLVPQQSTATVVLTPPEGTVFKGAPGSWVMVDLTPTIFQSPVNSYDQNPKKDKGYHIRYDAQSRRGNYVDASQFSQFYGCPVTIQMQTAASTLIVKRDFKQSFIVLITGVLGAVSGLAGAMVMILGTLENIQKGVNGRKLKKLRQGAERNNGPSVIEELKECNGKQQKRLPPKGDDDDFRQPTEPPVLQLRNFAPPTTRPNNTVVENPLKLGLMSQNSIQKTLPHSSSESDPMSRPPKNSLSLGSVTAGGGGGGGGTSMNKYVFPVFVGPDGEVGGELTISDSQGTLDPEWVVASNDGDDAFA